MARRARPLLPAAPVAFLGVFFAWPAANIVGEGLRSDGGWDLSGVGDVLGDPALRRVAWFTAAQAAASTLLTLLVALPAAQVLARYEFRGRRAVQALVTVPFVLPTVVVGAAFLALLGPRGPLGVDLDDTIWAILLAHVFFNHAVVVRTVGGLWEGLDERTEEAARVLGDAGQQLAAEDVAVDDRIGLHHVEPGVPLWTWGAFHAGQRYRVGRRVPTPESITQRPMQ